MASWPDNTEYTPVSNRKISPQFWVACFQELFSSGCKTVGRVKQASFFYSDPQVVWGFPFFLAIQFFLAIPTDRISGVAGVEAVQCSPSRKAFLGQLGGVPGVNSWVQC